MEVKFCDTCLVEQFILNCRRAFGVGTKIIKKYGTVHSGKFLSTLMNLFTQDIAVLM